MRAVLWVVAAAILATGCSGDKPVAATSQTSSEEIRQRNCADPQWREPNLGLWYSVCRQSSFR